MTQKKILGRQPYFKGINPCDFIAQCVRDDDDALGEIWDDEPENTLKDARNPDSWCVWMEYPSERETLDDFFDETQFHWPTKYLLRYLDEQGNPVKVKQEDICAIYLMIMGDYSTNYCITVFQTHDGTLLLGHNDDD